MNKKRRRQPKNKYLNSIGVLSLRLMNCGVAYLRVDKEGYPGDNYEEARGEVVGHHVEGHLPGQH
jgi:hypothetical protein